MIRQLRRQLKVRLWWQKYWLSLAGVACLSGGLIACASNVKEGSSSAVESPSALADGEAASIADADGTAGTSATGDGAVQARGEILMIGPRPDRDPPLRDCGSLQKQQEMNACAYENYQTVDAELNEAYQQMKAALPQDGKQALETAELAWLEFRDLDCGWERSQFEGGSIAPLIYNSCLETRTNIRINELYEPTAGESSYQAADSALNAAYQQLTEVVESPRDEALVDTQLAWIEYRDRHCEFEANYGARAVTADQCKARLSEKRTRQVRAAVEQNSL